MTAKNNCYLTSKLTIANYQEKIEKTDNTGNSQSYSQNPIKPKTAYVIHPGSPRGFQNKPLGLKRFNRVDTLSAAKSTV